MLDQRRGDSSAAAGSTRSRVLEPVQPSRHKGSFFADLLGLEEGLEECQECTRPHAQLLDRRPPQPLGCSLTWTTAIPNLSTRDILPLRVRERGRSHKKAANWNPLVFTQSSEVGWGASWNRLFSGPCVRVRVHLAQVKPPSPTSKTQPSCTDYALRQEGSAWLSASNNRLRTLFRGTVSSD